MWSSTKFKRVYTDRYCNYNKPASIVLNMTTIFYVTEHESRHNYMPLNSFAR